MMPPPPTFSVAAQVASGRFGVTPEFLVNADQLEIKVAQVGDWTADWTGVKTPQGWAPGLSTTSARMLPPPPPPPPSTPLPYTPRPSLRTHTAPAPRCPPP